MAYLPFFIFMRETIVTARDLANCTEEQCKVLRDNSTSKISESTFWVRMTEDVMKILGII